MKKGLLDEKQLDEALKNQMIFGGRLGTNLVELGILDEETLARLLSESLGVPYASPKSLLEIDQEILDLVSKDVAKKYRVLPVKVNRKRLGLVMQDPQDYEAVQEIGFITGYTVEPMVTPELRLAQALELHYGITRDARYIPFRDDLRERKELEEIQKKKGEAPPEVVEVREAKKEEPREKIEMAPLNVPPPPVHAVDLGSGEEEEPLVTTPSEEASRGKKPENVDSLKEKILKLRDKRQTMLASKTSTPKKEEEPAEPASPMEALLLRLKASKDRNTVGRILLEYMANLYPFGAVMAVRGEVAHGWCATGSPDDGDLLGKLRVPLNVPSLFKQASAEGIAVHKGPDKNPMDKMLRKLIKVEDSLVMVATAVYYREATVCFLLSVGAAEMFTEQSLGEMKSLAVEAGNVFSKLIETLRSEAT